MLSYEVVGTGPPLMLLHGTMGSRRVWAPVVDALQSERKLVLVDLPGMGDSAPIPDASLPSDWVAPLGAVLDAVGLSPIGVVGHSMGGWAALELAKAGRATAVLALTPAGLWERSPRGANASLRIGRLMARLTPPAISRRALGVAAIRKVALRGQSVDAGRIPAEWAVALAADARRARGFGAHFAAARRERFTGGADIEVPVRVVFAGCDRIATPPRAQLTDELPAHAEVESWSESGHMVMWDATDRVIAAALEVPTGPAS